MSLFVGNLNYDISKEQLQEVFGKFGEVSRVSFRKATFAFVDFVDSKSADAAIKALQGTNVGDARLHIEYTKNSDKYAGDFKVCFECKSNDHLLRDCPQLSDAQKSHQREHRPRGPRREQNGDVVPVSDRGCRFFLSEAGCKKGDECPYSHADGAVAPPPRAPRQPRRQMNDVPVAAHAAVAADVNAPPKRQQRRRRQQPRRFADEEKRENGPAAPRLCRFYQTEEGCRKGSECNFEHSDSAVAAPRRDAGFVAVRTQKVCPYWDTEEGCRQGDQCRKLHQGQGHNASPREPREPRAPREPRGDGPREPRPPRPCRWYNTEEGCRKGADCRMIHEGAGHNAVTPQA